MNKYKNSNLQFFNFDSFTVHKKNPTKKVLKTSKHTVKNSSRAIYTYFENINNCEKGRPQSDQTKLELEKAPRDIEKVIGTGLPPGPRI